MPTEVTDWAKLEQELLEAGREQEAFEASTINLIASDNVVPGWRALERPYRGDMIQEGIVGKRPFAGAAYHDRLEGLAAQIAVQVFGVDHAVLQAHSCSQANQAVYQALLAPGDPVLALDFRAGGHLTHGMRRNFSGLLYDFRFYGVGDDGRIDYEGLEKRALEMRPKLIICGSSSYPWRYDIARLRLISDSVGARLMLDVSHEGGLIAGGAFDCDLAVPDVATMSLDKTMRGCHGAAILCRAELADRIDAAVHPGTQSSFPVARVSDAAKTLLETQTVLFRSYASQAIELGRVLAAHLEQLKPGSVVGGSTEKHYLLLDTEKAFGRNGTAAELELEGIGVLSNRQTLPDARSGRLRDAGGLRLGTAWLASSGYSVADVIRLGDIIHGFLAGRLQVAAAADAVRDLAKESRPGDVRAMESSAGPR